jgi:hypothetical protein
MPKVPFLKIVMSRDSNFHNISVVRERIFVKTTSKYCVEYAQPHKIEIRSAITATTSIGYYIMSHVRKLLILELCQSCQERNLMMFLKDGKFVIFIVSNLFTHCCPIDRILEGMKYHAKIHIEIFQGGVA